MMQKIWMFFAIMCVCTGASAFFEELEHDLSVDEIAAAGLHKLTVEERHALEELIFRSKRQYPAMISCVDHAEELKWIYEAKPFAFRNDNWDHSFNEKKMKHDLSVCAMFQHEAPWLKEWIEYHKLMGVQHFYLYNNLSNDAYLDVLEPYVIKGEVELFQYPVKQFPPGTQNYAYQDAIVRARGVTRWLAIIDTDEFIVPMPPFNDLLSLLSKFEKYGGLTVNWQMFGTSDVDDIPEGKLLIETLTRKAPHFHGENVFVKSIVKPHRVFRIGDPHYCKYYDASLPVDSSLKISESSYNSDIPIDKVRIHHYWTRTKNYYNTVKVPRRIKYEGGPRDPEGVKEHMATLNSEEDTSILRFVPKLKKALAQSQ